MTLDLDELLAQAEAAMWTGRWYDGGCGTLMAETAQGCDDVAHPIPTGIVPYLVSVQPAAIQALAERLRAAESENTALRDTLSKLTPASEAALTQPPSAPPDGQAEASGGKRMQMRMAKADDADMDVAYSLYHLLDAIDRGYYPSSDEAKDQETSEIPTWFDSENYEHLQHLHGVIAALADKATGSLPRVIGAASILLNPKNALIDPNDDCIELHPNLKKALQQASQDEGPTPQGCDGVPDGVREALQRLIENGAALGKASADDALLVARYRGHLFPLGTENPTGAPEALVQSAIHSAVEAERQVFNRVIDHAISLLNEADPFLRCWREGNWDGCREFDFEPDGS